MIVILSIHLCYILISYWFLFDVLWIYPSVSLTLIDDEFLIQSREFDYPFSPFSVWYKQKALFWFLVILLKKLSCFTPSGINTCRAFCDAREWQTWFSSVARRQLCRWLMIPAAGIPSTGGYTLLTNFRFLWQHDL